MSSGHRERPAARDTPVGNPAAAPTATVPAGLGHGLEAPDVFATLAPEARLARVARNVVATCAALEGFSIDDLGDVRLLVDATFHALTQIGVGPIDVSVAVSDGGLAVEMSARRRGTRTWHGPELGMLVATATVVTSDREFAVVGDRLALRSVVHRTPFDDDA
ncbi:MAG: hypothetical protein ABW122_07715 [Ilumatobacteraceae bacterium]